MVDIRNNLFSILEDIPSSAPASLLSEPDKQSKLVIESVAVNQQKQVTFDRWLLPR